MSEKYDERTRLRLEAQAIQKYLETLNRSQPPVSREVVEGRLVKAEKALAVAEEKGNWLKVMDAVERINQHNRTLQAIDDGESLELLERAFIETGASYAARKGVSYATFRYVGVPTRVLQAAGIRNS